jgi:transketolase
MLRAVPHLTDFRPADANETAAAWRLAIERTGPCFFALSRQDLPVIDPTTVDVYGGVSKGAYVLQDSAKPQVVFIATGSEVSAAVEAAKLLSGEGIQSRVVSMPSVKIFDEQSDAYKASVLLSDVPRIAVEAGASLGWWKYVGLDGDVVGLDRFGASAPGRIVLEKLGFGAASIAARAKKLLK